MRILKGNILIAETVCATSFLFFVCISFLPKNLLYEIGVDFENIFHIHTKINILTMQSFLITISSGIFTSTLVAWFFYKQEFQRNKEIVLSKILKCNSKITKLYANIPYIEYLGDTEFEKLARDYYYEYYSNRCCVESLKEGKACIDKLLKLNGTELDTEYNKMLESAISHKAENQLRKFLLKHENNAEVQDRLDSIIRTLDYKIEKATIAYNKILQYDITELKELVKDVCASNKISCRKKDLF